MEIDVTSYFSTVDHPSISGSRAELGQNAAQITFDNAKQTAAERPLLVGEDQFEEARKHFRSYGAWEEAEIAAWTRLELNAMIAQEVSAAVRESDLDDATEEDWARYEADEDNRGRLFRNADKVYLYLGE